MSCPARIYPLRKPKNHRVPIPRWMLSLPEDIERVYTAYIGIQHHSESEAAAEAKAKAIDAIQAWLKREDGPPAFEAFTTINGNDEKNTIIWVCYWTNANDYTSSIQPLSLPTLHSSLFESGRSTIGLWLETFTTSISRLETNYSGLDYLPGLAQLPLANTKEHTLSAYWGAARDRIPDSAHDLFPRAEDVKVPETQPTGLGQHLTGTNPSNIVHIRSGQYWETCNDVEANAYTSKLEPTLEAGLEYLYTNPLETGTLGLRYMRNISSFPSSTPSPPKKETCGAGFFANLSDLEKWAKSHPSHLKIYSGAMAHYKAFGEDRMFRTWHEVSVIEQGEARFEYLNCVRGTGVMGRVELAVVS